VSAAGRGSEALAAECLGAFSAAPGVCVHKAGCRDASHYCASARQSDGAKTRGTDMCMAAGQSRLECLCRRCFGVQGSRDRRKGSTPSPSSHPGAADDTTECNLTYSTHHLNGKRTMRPEASGGTIRDVVGRGHARTADNRSAGCNKDQYAIPGFTG
jgi:hypothetical protein